MHAQAQEDAVKVSPEQERVIMNVRLYAEEAMSEYSQATSTDEGPDLQNVLLFGRGQSR